MSWCCSIHNKMIPGSPNKNPCFWCNPEAIPNGYVSKSKASSCKSGFCAPNDLYLCRNSSDNLKLIMNSKNENQNISYEYVANTWFHKNEKEITNTPIMNLVFDELKMALLGDSYSINFVKNSGIPIQDLKNFKLNDSRNIEKVSDSMDVYCLALLSKENPKVSMEEIKRLRLSLVDKLMRESSIGKYSK